jgi:peptidoglycan/LPS O-acetylase OafA/YrhL
MNSNKNEYQFRFSETASTNLYIIRILSSQMIAIGHIIEGLGFFELGNYIAGPILGFFFLMSGVLIAHNVFRRKKDESYNFSQFFKRRYFRIYPNFFLVLLIILLLDSIWLFLLGGEDLYKSFNIVSFLISLVFLNDSLLGITSFGSARQLWALPPIWWLYMFFGWLVLGKRQSKKKYLYYIILGAFMFLLIFIWLGFNTWIKIQFSLMWFLGAAFVLIMNKFDIHIKNNLVEEMPLQENNSEKLRKKIIYYPKRVFMKI